MKKMKKLLSLALACVMAMSLVTVSSADEGEDIENVNTGSANLSSVDVSYNMTNNAPFKNGSITIDGIHEDIHEDGESNPGHIHTKYDVYKMLHLESYNTSTNAYSYRVVKEWVEFFTTGAGKNYITLDSLGHATWSNASQSDDTKAAFAQLALTYAQEKNIQPVMTTATPYVAGTTENGYDPGYGFKKSEDGSQGLFHGLTLGYYLLDSNVGVLCGLTTTNPNAEVVAKNGSPLLTKTVKEDASGEYRASNSAGVGDLVEFRVEVKVHAGAQSYILHDDMDNALNYKEVVSVIHTNPDNGDLSLGELLNSADSSRDYYTVKTTGLCNSSCDFEIVFTDTFCNHLESNDYFYVFYTAYLNENAVEHVTENTAHLTYGENSVHTTVDSKTQTYCYGFDLLKTDSNNTLLGGDAEETCAIFEIYTNDQVTITVENGVTKYTYDTPMKFIKTTNGNNNILYRPLSATEQSTSGIGVDESVVTNGHVRIAGLDNGIYYLREIQAPSGGYKLLGEPVKFTISDGNFYANYDSAGQYTGTGTAIQVVNNTGTALPTTGGMGTTMFITCGSVLVLACGLLLVTKKRMNMIQD